MTGLNDAFLIDQETRDRLVLEDPNCEPVIKKFLRGESLQRWSSQWEGEWMIFARKGIDIALYPSIKAHLSKRRAFLEPRPADWNEQQQGRWLGRKPGAYEWFELQDTIDYFERFDSPKIIYQDISFHSVFALDRDGLYANNTCYFISSDSLPLLACLSSSLVWWFLGGFAQRAKDDAFRLHTSTMERLPIPPFSDLQAKFLRAKVESVIRATERVQQEVNKFTLSIQTEGASSVLPSGIKNFWVLDEPAFLGLIRRAKLSAGPLFEKRILHEFLQSRNIVRPLQREIRRVEFELHHAVFNLYGLTPEEVRLVRETAPPRDPLRLAEEELAELERD